jgi:hypothetical protein
MKLVSIPDANKFLKLMGGPGGEGEDGACHVPPQTPVKMDFYLVNK